MEQRTVIGHTAAGPHKISCAVWPAQQNKDVPVVCVHGLLRNGRDFDKLARELSASRMVLCPDMPGRGRSDNLANPQDYTLDQYRCDIPAVTALGGSNRFDWVGTSMGGLLGMMIAGEANSPIRKLVLNDVGPILPEAALRAIGDYMDKTPESFESVAEVEALLRKNYAAWGALQNEDWSAMAAQGHRTGADGKIVIGYDRAIGLAFKEHTGDINLWETYDRITCPVLLLRGANSALLTADIAAEMTRRGPRAQLVEIEGCGHAPSLMTKDQIKRVTDFING